MAHRRPPCSPPPSRWLTAFAIALLARPAVAANPITARPPADPICAASTGKCTPPPYVAIMSAFPAELEPTIAKASVDETLVIDGRTYYLGTLGSARVVMVLSGIGLVNAATTTQALLDRFEVKMIVFSGVAGSRQNIADVAVPAHWSDGTTTYDADATLLATAQTVAASPPMLEQCTFNPPEPQGPMVCLNRTPQIVVGGDGQSEDPFNGTADKCQPNGGPIFGCDVRPPAATAAVEPGSNAGVDASQLDAQDMETAAMARVATAAGVPFIAFRGVSDGPGDPLNLGGFPNQFFTYYQIAADNASASVAGLLAAITQPSGAPDAYGRGRATLVANTSIGSACDWERAAGAVCANNLSPRVVTAAITRACGALVDAADTTLPPRKQRHAAHQARAAFKLAARHIKHDRLPGIADTCKQVLLPALVSRSKPSS